MKILSSLTHPQVVPNQSEFLSSAEHKRRISVDGFFFFHHTMKVNPYSSKYLLLCLAEERNVYRIGTMELASSYGYKLMHKLKC